MRCPTKPRRLSSQGGQWQDGRAVGIGAGSAYVGKTSADYAMRRDDDAVCATGPRPECRCPVAYAALQHVMGHRQ